MEFKGTKGDWTVGDSDTHNYVYNNASDDPCRNFTIAECDHVGIQNKESKANAQLIASAPDLLKALKSLIWEVKRLELSHGQCVEEELEEELRESQQAINKALNK